MTTMDARTLRAVMNTMIDGVITIDAQGTVRSFNPAAARIFGYAPEEVIGHNVKMLMPEPYHSEHDSYLENYERTGIAKIIGIGREVSARRKDGTVFPISLGVTATDLADDHAYVGIIHDITERKQQEANKIFLELLMDNIVDGLITIDERGTILQVNRAVEHMFGYKPEELLGQNVSKVMVARDAAVHDQYISHYLGGGAPKIIGVPGREMLARRKDGIIFPIELGVSEMHVHGKRVFAGLVRDISVRKALEQQKQAFTADLARSNQELDDFAYIASHDLKEPLRGVANNAMFLKEDCGNVLDEKGIKRLDRMVFLCQRMERLIEDLLYFSRLGRQRLAVQATDLNEVIRDILAMRESTIQEQKVEIVIPVPLPTIVCDRPRITEVFRNLISNAIKYNNKPNKRVEIGCVSMAALVPEASDEEVFYVRDNGIGIPKEFHAEIFRIFKRLNEEDDSVKGTGVGLTFVQKIIDRHNGRIWLESEVGEGTTFYFTINAAEEAGRR